MVHRDHAGPDHGGAGFPRNRLYRDVHECRIDAQHRDRSAAQRRAGADARSPLGDAVNFSRDRNTVVELAPGIEGVQLGSYWDGQVWAREGEPYGQIVGPRNLRTEVHRPGPPERQWPYPWTWAEGLVS